MRHVLVAVLVVVVVNAQLTWWVIFVLRENRTRLELERDRMAAACREEAARVRVELDRAREVLADWKVSGEGYGSAGLWRWPPEPPPEASLAATSPSAPLTSMVPLMITVSAISARAP